MCVMRLILVFRTGEGIENKLEINASCLLFYFDKKISRINAIIERNNKHNLMIFKVKMLDVLS